MRHAARPDWLVQCGRHDPCVLGLWISADKRNRLSKASTFFFAGIANNVCFDGDGRLALDSHFRHPVVRFKGMTSAVV